MSLVGLSVRNLRIIKSADIGLSPSLNLIVGANAAGKTSLLEAAYFLSTGRSFRTSRVLDLMRTGADAVLVRGEVAGADGVGTMIGVERSAAGTRARVGGQPVGAIVELAERLPVVAVYPEGENLLTGPPALRRGLVDWGLFHRDPGFRELRGRYLRALRQRNAALRGGGSPAVVAAWEDELGETGERLGGLRAGYVEALNQAIGTLPFGTGAELVYRAGWDREAGLSAVLEVERERDRTQGFTRAGAHRDDIGFRLDGQVGRRVASRGQQKMISAAVRLGQLRVLGQETGKRGLVLVDDLPSELDSERRGVLSEALAASGAQVMVSAIERTGVPVACWSDQRVFHVEHGDIRELI